MQRWHRLAPCVDWPMELFFPVRPVVDPEVLELCSGCPVSTDCLLEVLSLPRGEDFGIRAGTTPAQRDTLRRLLRREEGAARRKHPSVRRVLKPRRCAACEATFTPTNATQRYCTAACKARRRAPLSEGIRWERERKTA